NATVTFISAGRATALSNLLDDYPPVLMIEDDHFWQLSGHPYRSIISHGYTRWTLVRYDSKSLHPDLRVGIVGSDTLTASRLNTHIRSGAMWVSHLLQRLTYLLATNPQTPAKLAYAGAEYADANAQFVSALAAENVSAISDDG